MTKLEISQRCPHCGQWLESEPLICEPTWWCPDCQSFWSEADLIRESAPAKSDSAAAESQSTFL